MIDIRGRSIHYYREYSIFHLSENIDVGQMRL